AGQTLTAGGAADTAYNGTISGSGNFAKGGDGVLTLSNVHTYTGNTIVNRGTLQLGAANRLADASALVVSADGTFDLNSFSETLASVSGDGNVTFGDGNT